MLLTGLKCIVLTNTDFYQYIDRISYVDSTGMHVEQNSSLPLRLSKCHIMTPQYLYIPLWLSFWKVMIRILVVGNIFIQKAVLDVRV